MNELEAVRLAVQAGRLEALERQRTRAERGRKLAEAFGHWPGPGLTTSLAVRRRDDGPVESSRQAPDASGAILGRFGSVSTEAVETNGNGQG